jgi:hypothetical protein
MLLKGKVIIVEIYAVMRKNWISQKKDKNAFELIADLCVK